MSAPAGATVDPEAFMPELEPGLTRICIDQLRWGMLDTDIDIDIYLISVIMFLFFKRFVLPGRSLP